MKYSKKIIIGLALCAGIVTSCKEDEAGVSNNISTDKDEITIGPEGGTEQVAVSTNADWVASQPLDQHFPRKRNGFGRLQTGHRFYIGEQRTYHPDTVCSGRTRT